MSARRPMSAKSTGSLQQRPTSAASTAASIVQAKREQRSMLALLRGTIAETYKEPPPGLTPAALAAKRQELETLLAAVERDQHMSAADQANFQAERWAAAMDDQIARESLIMQEGAKKDARHAAALTQFREDREERLHAQRDRREEHIVKSHDHIVDTIETRIATVETEMERRDEKLSALRLKRDRESIARFQRQQAAERHAEEMIRRRDEAAAKRMAEQERAMKEHRRLAEERAERVQSEKDRRRAEAKARQATANVKGSLNRVRVNLRSNQGVTLEIEEIDYAGRLERLRTTDTKRDTMVTAVKGELRDERRDYERRRADVRSRIEDNHEKEVAARMHRQWVAKCTREIATLTTDEVKARKALYLEEASFFKSVSVAAHTSARDMRLLDKQNTGHRKVYDRWTRKAGVISDHISHSTAFRAAAIHVSPGSRPRLDRGADEVKHDGLADDDGAEGTTEKSTLAMSLRRSATPAATPKADARR